MDCWWCRAGGLFRGLNSALFGGTGQAGVFMLLPPAPSQAVNANKDGGLFLTTGQHYQGVPRFYGATVLSLLPAISMPALVSSSLPSSVTSNGSSVPLSLPSDP